MINLTDLSMGKTEASPAFSRLQPYQNQTSLAVNALADISKIFGKELLSYISVKI